jgi:hypothetical protein
MQLTALRLDSSQVLHAVQERHGIWRPEASRETAAAR